MWQWALEEVGRQHAPGIRSETQSTAESKVKNHGLRSAELHWGWRAGDMQ